MGYLECCVCERERGVKDCLCMFLRGRGSVSVYEREREREREEGREVGIREGEREGERWEEGREGGRTSLPVSQCRISLLS